MVPRLAQVGVENMKMISSLLLVMGCWWSATAAADEVLKVGVRDTPPFSYQDADGHWRGISVELWEQLATSLQREFVYLPQPQLDPMLDDLANNRLDVAIGALTVTSAREVSADFTHPFYTAGVGIAARAEKTSLLKSVSVLWSPRFLSAVAALGLVLLGVGVLMWLLERRHNAQFPKPLLQGIGDGFWWSAVTMTTVGYGDKAPVTFGGRVLGLIWMFVGIITISGFTAAMTSSLTLQQLGDDIQGPEDLKRVRVVSVQGSTAADYLEARGIAYQARSNAQEAMDALVAGTADAVVYDRPILRHLMLEQSLSQLRLLPQVLGDDAYAIMLQPGSALREPLNRELLALRASPFWTSLLTRYLGS